LAWLQEETHHMAILNGADRPDLLRAKLTLGTVFESAKLKKKKMRLFRA